jgi:predicted ATPase
VRDGDLWLPAREIRRALPAERDAFVGREGDLRALADLAETARLVTVLGAGGTGKTRLVTRFAWVWLGEWPGGAWFCDLAEARDADGIATAVARALDVQLGKADPVVQLGHAIASRGRSLVVLDNFEQVARFAPETLGRWLDIAAEATFLVTSRQLLGLPGETVLSLEPLDEAGAIALFTARASQVSAGAVSSEADRSAVRELVRLLDGLPLAIELAAARVRLMPPGVLLQRMSERFRLLASGGGRPSRQATLRATIDWSWNLLEPAEQAALAQLAVFSGGFALEAVEAVLSVESGWAADLLQALLDRSLVRRTAADRFDLLVSVQEYASEKLDAAGSRTATEIRHGAHYAAALPRGDVDAAGRELENLLAACRRAVRRGDVERAVDALARVAGVYALRGSSSAGVALAEQVAAMPGHSLATRSRAERALGRMFQMVGRLDRAEEHLEVSLAAARELGDGRLEGGALNIRGTVRCMRGQMDEARADLEAAVALLRRAGDRMMEGLALGNLGQVHEQQGRVAEARRCYADSLAAAVETEDHAAEGRMTHALGAVARRQGDLAEARTRFEAASALATARRDRRGEAVARNALGLIAAVEQRWDDALAEFRSALGTHREVGDRMLEGDALCNLANVQWNRGERPDLAREGWEAALALHREAGNRRAEAIDRVCLGIWHAKLGDRAVADASFEAALAAARSMGDPWLEADVLVNIAAAAADHGRYAEAKTSAEAAVAVARRVGYAGGADRAEDCLRAAEAALSRS